MNRLISVLILFELIDAFESSVPLQRTLFLHFTVWRSRCLGFTWTIVPFCKAQPSVLCSSALNIVVVFSFYFYSCFLLGI